MGRQQDVLDRLAPYLDVIRSDGFSISDRNLSSAAIVVSEIMMRSSVGSWSRDEFCYHMRANHSVQVLKRAGLGMLIGPTAATKGHIQLSFPSCCLDNLDRLASHLEMIEQFEQEDEVDSYGDHHETTTDYATSFSPSSEPSEYSDEQADHGATWDTGGDAASGSPSEASVSPEEDSDEYHHETTQVTGDDRAAAPFGSPPEASEDCDEQASHGATWATWDTGADAVSGSFAGASTSLEDSDDVYYNRVNGIDSRAYDAVSGSPSTKAAGGPAATANNAFPTADAPAHGRALFEPSYAAAAPARGSLKETLARGYKLITLADLQDEQNVMQTKNYFFHNRHAACAVVGRLAGPRRQLQALALASPGDDTVVFVLDVVSLQEEFYSARRPTPDLDKAFAGLVDKFLSALMRGGTGVGLNGAGAPPTLNWVTHSCSALANAFYDLTKDTAPPASLLDVQLVAEHLGLDHPRHTPFDACVDLMAKGIVLPGGLRAKDKKGNKGRHAHAASPGPAGGDVPPWAPLPHSKKQQLAQEAKALAQCAGQEAFQRALDAGTSVSKYSMSLPQLQRASAARWTDGALRGGAQRACFDIRSYQLRSPELLVAANEGAHVAHTGNLEVNLDGIEALLELLPTAVRGTIDADRTEIEKDIVDIVMDVGRQPYVKRRATPYHFLSEAKVTREDIADLHEHLKDRIGPDSRAGLPQSLHRISFMYDHSGEPYGATLRVGRSLRHVGDILLDLLWNTRRPQRSVLLLGKPGSGKTSMLRDLTRRLAEKRTVVIVDTSNEIAGDDMVPHADVGMARRMMVPSVDEQHSVMVEAVQNHTPDAMVVDEIGRRQEVTAAKTVVNRSVSLLASAHGDLRSVMRNPDLRGLCGELSTVIRTGGHTVTERASQPIFDTVVELSEKHDELIVITDVPAAVDAILRGERYLAEKRLRLHSGNFSVDPCWR